MKSLTHATRRAFVRLTSMINHDSESVRELYCAVYERALATSGADELLATDKRYAAYCVKHRTELRLAYVADDPEIGPAEWTCRDCVKSEREASERFAAFVMGSCCIACRAPTGYCECRLADSRDWPDE
jgi:hypothetical protein